MLPHGLSKACNKEERPRAGSLYAQHLHSLTCTLRGQSVETKSGKELSGILRIILSSSDFSESLTSSLCHATWELWELKHYYIRMDPRIDKAECNDLIECGGSRG